MSAPTEGRSQPAHGVDAVNDGPLEPNHALEPTEPSRSVAGIASKAASVIAMRIIWVTSETRYGRPSSPPSSCSMCRSHWAFATAMLLIPSSE